MWSFINPDTNMSTHKDLLMIGIAVYFNDSERCD